jgi:hypothetical protein
MRAGFAIAMMMLMATASAHAADPSKLAVFDFEMMDTSLEGQINGPRLDEQQRLLRAGDQLRKELGESGKFRIIDIAPVNAAAHQSHLQACGGCDVKLAKQIGADIAVTGVVQKVSNLILNVNVYMRDTGTGRLVRGASVDTRGNTDESWSRAVHYLVQERLLAINPGAPAAH